jgi:alpha-galactosidase
MRRFSAGVSTLWLCLVTGWCIQAGEVRNLKAWREEVKSGRSLPFSFKIGEQDAQFDLVEATDLPADQGWQRTKVLYREKTQPLSVALICDFSPAMDMVRTTLTLQSLGAVTGTVRHISILDLAVSKNEAAVHGQSGGFADDRQQYPPTGSKPWVMPILDGLPLEAFSGGDGRSSNEQLPLWLYAEKDGGLWYGPEWSGCWYMAVRPTTDGRRLLVGLPTFDFIMKMGETTTLPTAAFGPYSGSPDDGFNQLRRMIHGYYLPTVEGKKPQPLVYWEGYGAHPSYATEEELYREVDQAAQVGCEVFCLDGGWNVPPEASGNWYNAVGHWGNQGRFSKGVKVFGEYVKSKGMKFGVWIEPRATKGCPLYDKHAELFYPGGEGLMRLDLPGGPEMFQGVFDQLIRDYGVDWVWLDYNVSPRTLWWNKMESADRKGLMELGFYQGWYKAIDETFKKHPNLWIESCASGGRIIDLGQLRRSQSIWVADEAVVDDACRNRRHGLNHVLPAVCIQSSMFIAPEFQLNVKPDASLGGEHRFLTYFSGDFGFAQGLPFWKAEDIQAAANYVAIYKRYRHYLEGDYYHLLPMPTTRDAWDGCQYHDPQSRSGILLMYRLGESKQEETSIRPRAVDKVGQYRWSVIAGEAVVQAAGEGLTVRMGTSHASLMYYQRKTATSSGEE